MPNRGMILTRIVSIDTVPGMSQGKPPKKKSLDNSISNKTEDMYKTKWDLDLLVSCNLNSLIGATANRNINDKNNK